MCIRDRVTTARALYGQKEFADSLKDRMDAAAQAYEAKMMELEGATPKGRRTTKGRF